MHSNRNRRARRLVAGLAVVGVAFALSSSAATAQDIDVSLDPPGPYEETTEVEVSASGFSPGLAIAVTQCAVASPQEVTDATTQCDIANAVFVDTDADGNVTATQTVTVGAFLDSTCDADNPCILTVGEPSSEPGVERGFAELDFGGATDQLAETGASTTPIVWVAVALAAIGGLALVAGRLVPAGRRS